MTTFTLMLAHDVSVYGTFEVEADSLAAAVEKVRADLDDRQELWDDVTDTDWSTSHNFRIVTIQSNDDPTNSHALDGLYLSEDDESTPRSAEEVLAEVTKRRISK